MAEELKVNITGDASQLKGALEGAGKQVTGFSDKIGKIGKVATIAGIAVVAAFTKIVTSTAAVGDKFDKMSLRTGIAVEDLSSLAYAADISGTSIETMEKGLKGLTMSMNDMSMGMGEAKDAYEKLGVAVVNTDGELRSTMDVFKEIATRITDIENPTLQASLAMDIFGGRAGPQLLPLLKMGEKGIDDLMAKAKELGITMSTEAATKAAEFTDRMTDLKGSLAGVGRSIGEILIPILIPMIEKVTEVVKKVSDWAKENPKLIATITKVGATLGILAAAGGPILLATAAFLKMAPAIAAVKTAMLTLGTVASGPIGLLILAVGGLYVAWEKNLFGIKDITINVFDSIKGNFVDLTETLGGGGGGAGAFFDEIEKVPKIFELCAVASGKLGAGLSALGKTWTDVGKEIKNTIRTMQNDFLPVMRDVEDTIYRLTHTEYETSLRNINRRYNELIERAKTLHYTEKELLVIIEKLNEARRLETEELDQSNAAKDITISKNIELAASYGDIGKELDELKGKIEAVFGAPFSLGMISGPFKLGTYKESAFASGSPIAGSQVSSIAGSQSTYSPTVQVTVQGNGNAGEIKKAVEQALDESARQYNRRGFETVPGIG